MYGLAQTAVTIHCTSVQQHGKAMEGADHLWEPPQLRQDCMACASLHAVEAPSLDRSSLCDFAASHSTGTSSKHAS